MLWSEDLASLYFSLAVSISVVVHCVMLILVLLRRQWSQALPIVGSVVVFVAICWAMVFEASSIRIWTRWALYASKYKTQFARENPNGVGHVEWECSGFVPAGFNCVYLVRDPTDELSKAAGKRNVGRVPGVRCQVFRVQRLEPEWYAIEFYTDTSWDYCPPDAYGL